MSKTFSLPDILTDAEIQRCVELYPNRKRIRDEVIIPNLSRINKAMRQDNDADYLSWAVIYVLSEHARRNTN